MSTMRDDIFDSLLPFLDELVDIACDHIEAMEKDEEDLCDSESFNIDMVLEQIEDYGKYKGVLYCNEDKCENFIPVSVAKQIVKGRGIGGVLGYVDTIDKGCSTCKNNMEFPPPHTCDICTSLDQIEEYEMWEAK